MQTKHITWLTLVLMKICNEITGIPLGAGRLGGWPTARLGHPSTEGFPLRELLTKPELLAYSYRLSPYSGFKYYTLFTSLSTGAVRGLFLKVYKGFWGW